MHIYKLIHLYIKRQVGSRSLTSYHPASSQGIHTSPIHKNEEEEEEALSKCSTLAEKTSLGQRKDLLRKSIEEYHIE